MMPEGRAEIVRLELPVYDIGIDCDVFKWGGGVLFQGPGRVVLARLAARRSPTCSWPDGGLTVAGADGCCVGLRMA